MSTDGTTPDGAAAAVAADESAQQAAASADKAVNAADAAMQAAAEAAVSAAIAIYRNEFNAALDELRKQNASEDAHEAEDDATVSKLQSMIMTIQSQSLWINCVCLLVGAAVCYVLTTVVFG